MFAVATALLGAGLGVAADLVAGPAGGESRTQILVRGGTLIFLLISGSGSLVYGARLWRRERRRLQGRGTLYVVEEIAQNWTPEERQRFLVRASDHYANVLRVPGPGELGMSWNWAQTDARVWRDRLDDLVRSFWAVHHNDNFSTMNCVAIWAEWPVAWSFGQRAIASDRRRGLDLQVCRRDSSGRGGRFVADPMAPPLIFTVSRVRSDPAEVFHHSASLIVHQTESCGAATKGALVLLVRMTPTPWGPISTESRGDDARVEIVINDAANTGLAVGPQDADVLEWRYVSPRSGHDPADFPWLAQMALEWILAEAAKHRDDIILLGLIVPQEVSIGLGILAARSETELPAHLWPLVRATGSQPNAQFIIPNLDLGGSR